MNRHPYNILIGPLLTEKATEGQSHTRPQYSFKVAIDSNKVEIRKAVETAFKVKVVSVNTLVTKGQAQAAALGQAWAPPRLEKGDHYAGRRSEH